MGVTIASIEARITGHDHATPLEAFATHGADHLAVWLSAPLGEQESLIFLDAKRFFRPPYVGVRGWVGVRIDGRPNWAQVATLVKQAYREVLRRH